MISKIMALAFGLLTMKTLGAVDPSTVLVLVNDAYPAEVGTGTTGASIWVGTHYAQVRNISSDNVLHLNIPLSVMISVGVEKTYDLISYANYAIFIQNPVQTWLSTHANIFYIVPTYGIPYKISDSLPGDAAKTPNISIDSILAGMNSKDLTTFVPNPYYNASNNSTPTHFSLFLNPKGWKMYIVSRLDGPSALIAAGEVDSAIQAESNPSWKTAGTAYFDWAGTGNYPDVTMQNASVLSKAAGVPTFLNNQNTPAGNGLLAPASTYSWNPTGGVSIFSQGVSTVTSRFTFGATNSGNFNIGVLVLENYASYAPGKVWMRTYSTDRASWWELYYALNGSAPNVPGPGTLTKFVAGKNVASCGFTVSTGYPVDTKQISYQFAPGTATAFKNGTALCTLTDTAATSFQVSQAEIVIRDIGGPGGDLLTGIKIADANGNALWNDSFTTNTIGNYQWMVMPKEAQNSSFAWGWYSQVHDAYTVIPGSIMAQLTSYTANKLRSGGVPEQDNYWVPYFLRLGSSAAWGPTGEPYVSGFAMGDNLFGHIFTGYSFGEAAYIASPFLNWMMIFVGDPFYMPNLSGKVTGPPVINSSLSTAGILNQPYIYQITTTGGNAVSYGASGLPPGLSINTKTGLISGVLGVASSTTIKIRLTASNVQGTGTADMTLQVRVGGQIH